MVACFGALCFGEFWQLILALGNEDSIFFKGYVPYFLSSAGDLLQWAHLASMPITCTETS